MLPVLLMILFGIINMGRAVYTYNTLANAARSGARVAAVNQIESSGGKCDQSMPITDPGDPGWSVKGCTTSAAIALGLQESNVTVTYSAPPTLPGLGCPLGGGSGLHLDCVATVTAQIEWRPITPILGNITIVFASGCHFLISITSAGQIAPAGKPPYFVVIDRALRDEGTSYHYAAPSEYSEAGPHLVATAARALKAKGVNIVTGSSWTTDAPFRETEEAIAAARSKGILAVEMEAAALYAFARATNKNVLCLAHVTNTMAVAEQDFEKGEADGTVDALRVLEAIIGARQP